MEGDAHVGLRRWGASGRQPGTGGNPCGMGWCGTAAVPRRKAEAEEPLDPRVITLDGCHVATVGKQAPDFRCFFHVVFYITICVF